MPTTTLVLIVVAALAVVGGGLVFWLVRRGWARRSAAEYYHFRCPGCQRRLRYHARQVGHKGECSNCKRELKFPPVSRSGQ
jgi:hypothetical protein